MKKNPSQAQLRLPKAAPAAPPWMDDLRRMRDVEVHPAESPSGGASAGFEVSVCGKALAQVSEDPKGTVVRYYDQGWRFTRETSIVQRLIRAERKRNKKRRPDA